ncbi:hypothetical protein HPB50_029484 [Hyalomma asiaticum]|nr:hypothetical protein HPB50_029484 [Hyalomma asiaticum]
MRGAGADGFDNTGGGGGCLPTSGGPRFMTWVARYSGQPRWPAMTTVVRVNELWLKTPLAELEQTPYIVGLRRDCRDARRDDPENAPSALRK